MKINFERWGETILGAIVAVVAVGFFAFAAAQAGQTTSGGYDLTARFNRVDGVGVGADVRVSGVKVGVVKAVSLDTDTYLAQLTLSIDNGVNVLDESTARISTDGLLGGAYVAIEPAGMDPLPAGGEIPNTQGPVDIFQVFASMAQGQGNSETEEAAP